MDYWTAKIDETLGKLSNLKHGEKNLLTCSGFSGRRRRQGLGQVYHGEEEEYAQEGGYFQDRSGEVKTHLLNKYILRIKKIFFFLQKLICNE